MGFSHLLMAAVLGLHAPALFVLAPMMLAAGSFTLGLAPLAGSSFRRFSQIESGARRSPSCAFLFGRPS